MNHRAHLIGKNASSGGSERSNCQYNGDTNTWSGAKFGGSELGHIYDSFAYDPATGDVYSGTWASDVLQKWAYGDALTSWSNVSTSSQTLTGSTQPAMCWHPNLYGPGDGGLLVMSQSGGNGRLVAWRKSTDAWSVVSGTTHANSYTYPMRGGMVYVRGGGYVLAAFNPTTGGNTYKVAAGSGGSLGTVSTIDDVPIPCNAEGGSTQSGMLLDDPLGTDSAYILEKGGTDRVWKLSGTSWTLKGYTHPLEVSDTEYVVASCYPHGVFWRQYHNTTNSMVWRPND